ncbi:hypothetical protein B0H14DRAFT_2570456 [Mycena olivaceomarginata]|nr:hypothetical protein B0H14DRAFT_2570456 [Mycena olivaceomarginata]
MYTKAVELLEDAKQRAQVLENERHAESASRDLRHLVFAAPANVRGLVASASSSRGPSLAEREMWEDYALNGADFDAGDDAEDDDVRLRRLREEASIFGLWNPDKAARQLGLREDAVAQFIECRLQTWFGFVQIGKSQPLGVKNRQFSQNRDFQACSDARLITVTSKKRSNGSKAAADDDAIQGTFSLPISQPYSALHSAIATALPCRWENINEFKIAWKPKKPKNAEKLPLGKAEG